MSTLNRNGLENSFSQKIPTNNNEEVSAEDVRDSLRDFKDSKFNLLEDDAFDINTGDLPFNNILPTIGDYIKFMLGSRSVDLFWVEARLGAITSTALGVRLEGTASTNLPSAFTTTITDLDADSGGVFRISIQGGVNDYFNTNNYQCSVDASGLQNPNIELVYTGSIGGAGDCISSQSPGVFNVGSFRSIAGSTFYIARWTFRSVPQQIPTLVDYL